MSFHSNNKKNLGCYFVSFSFRFSSHLFCTAAQRSPAQAGNAQEPEAVTCAGACPVSESSNCGGQT